MSAPSTIASYAKIPPSVTHYSPASPYYLPINSITNGSLQMNVSSITARDMSTLNVNISTINGLKVDLVDIQTQQVNPISISGKVVPPSASGFTPLVSTNTNFNWVQGQFYTVQFPVEVNVTTPPSDSNAVVFVGCAPSDSLSPPGSMSIFTTPTTSNASGYSLLNATIQAPSTGARPLVVWAGVDNANTNATVGCLGKLTGSSVPIIVNRIS